MEKTPRNMGLSEEQLRALEGIAYILPDELVEEELVKKTIERIKIVDA